MKSSEFSFDFMPGLIILCASRLSLQTFLLCIFPLLFSSNPTTFFTNEHYQLTLLKQGYWNHHLLFSVAENKTKFPAFKHNWMLLLHQVTPSWSIRKEVPYRVVITVIPPPVQLRSTSGTSPCWKKNTARSRCVKGATTTGTYLYTQVVTPGWTRALQREPNCALGKRRLHSWDASDTLQHFTVPNMVLPQGRTAAGLTTSCYISSKVNS